MSGAVLIQTYGPIAELGGFDGLGPCPPDLAQSLIDEQRAEAVDHAREPLRYVPGSATWLAMRANRGESGPVLVLESQEQAIKRGRGRPRKVEQ
jgi:hypothetical protein